MLLDRIRKLRIGLEAQDVDFYISDNAYNNFYLFGFDISGVASLISKNRIYFICPDMLKEHLETNIKLDTNYSFADFKTAQNIIGRTILGFDPGLSLSMYLGLAGKKLKKISTVQELRSIKDSSEIEAIKKTVVYTEKLYKTLQRASARLTSEKDLYNLLRSRLAKDYELDFSFAPIIAAGANSRFPHYDSYSEAGLGPDRHVMIDIGVRFRRYCSDITRMLNVEKSAEKHFAALSAVQKEVIAFIKPGRSSSEIDEWTRNLLTKQGYKGKILHSTGHGVGLEVHEYPALSIKAKAEIKEGMVLTVEPGIYFPGKFGLRVEDMILVGKNSNSVLTAGI